ncbi:MAG: hypothetical protein Q4Q18_05755 [Methanobrevibacter sp.]|nr:hypothetical protein [Methanobrevibacter sp.]
MRMNKWEMDDELPYLYSRKRDEDTKPTRTEPANIKFGNLAPQELPRYIQILDISQAHKNRLINVLDIRAKNPKCSVEHKNGIVQITVEVENEYIKSRFHLRFDTQINDFYMLDFYHYYDGLESKEWFKREFERVKRKVGKDFFSYYFGFEGHFRQEIFTVTDDFKVTVAFGDGDFLSEYPEYKVDFENKRLVFYHMTDGHELFAGII